GVIRQYMECPPSGINMEFWARDLALVALGLRKLWFRIAKSKTDQLGKKKFILLERTPSKHLVKLLNLYLKVRFNTPLEEPLFLSKMRKKLSVAAVSAIVKCFAENAGLHRKYTTYSLRIGVQ
ncbi:672_t:CDS:2, partial [Ambispora leptoticha]